jgi:MarR family transcriptional regulator, organic hydroperoxide resistance regulator
MAAADTSHDLAWLLHRCGQRLQAVIDAIAIRHGLGGGLRDYIVLTLLDVEHPKTQSELAQLAGLDKTTLVSVLDRLEQAGLIQRKLDPHNRRTRTPVMTAKGRKVEHAVTAERMAVAVPGMTAKELQTLQGLLAKLEGACDQAGLKPSGSCV